MRLSLISLALLLVTAGEALACSCAPVDLVRDLPEADGAFVGTVLGASPRGSLAVYRFRVEQVYKGEIENRVDVVSTPGVHACGLELSIGVGRGCCSSGTERCGARASCSRVDAAAFLEFTDVEDNRLPPINWGGYVIGLLVLGAGTFFLLRRLRGYKTLR